MISYQHDGREIQRAEIDELVMMSDIAHGTIRW